MRWNRFRQIFISYHLAPRRMQFNFHSDERPAALPIGYHRELLISAYEMKQISADFHLISSFERQPPELPFLSVSLKTTNGHNTTTGFRSSRPHCPVHIGF